ncbi:hypothetical protein [Bacillus sp. es.036]|uniref:hypothetical protein n=1 Tax=Bacillus sp. es.036 TaxID=1761764 RepID=UPI000C002A9D|nr:hypothetical protein [Bacillus sp. es.036]PFG03032.1 hypothetical protein ATG70_4261 [Bacillus sp. es.036]
MAYADLAGFADYNLNTPTLNKTISGEYVRTQLERIVRSYEVSVKHLSETYRIVRSH